jgi:hypothetical protein
MLLIAENLQLVYMQGALSTALYLNGPARSLLFLDSRCSRWMGRKLYSGERAMLTSLKVGEASRKSLVNNQNGN